jgi:RsiW-degrading membrane proteinase PrsW (M82 family)
MRKLLFIFLFCLLTIPAFSQIEEYQEDTMDVVELTDTLSEEDYSWLFGDEEDDVLYEEETGPSAGMILLQILLALIPALVLIFYVVWRDRLHPEPGGQLVKAFFMGFLTIPLALLFASLIGQIFMLLPPIEGVGALLVTSLMQAAIPEESAKLLILWLFLRRCRHFDEHMDGIVYAVCVGMGFATVENILYVTGSGPQFLKVLSVGLSRAFLSIPGHFAFAVIMGYFYSLASFKGKQTHRKYMLMAWGFPVLAHALYDFLLFVMDAYPNSMWHMLLMMLFFGSFFYMQQLGTRSIAKALSHDTPPHISDQ